MKRQWFEVVYGSHDHDILKQEPVRVKIDVPEGEGDELLVWYDEKRKRTYTEVAGAFENMGAYWCKGLVTDVQDLKTEIEEELKGE